MRKWKENGQNEGGEFFRVGRACRGYTRWYPRNFSGSTPGSGSLRFVGYLQLLAALFGGTPLIIVGYLLLKRDEKTTPQVGLIFILSVMSIALLNPAHSTSLTCIVSARKQKGRVEKFFAPVQA